MEAKIFTLAEANAALERVVKPAMQRLTARIAALDGLKTEIEVLRIVVDSGASETNPDRAQLTRLEQRERRIQSEIREGVEAIQSAGGVIKDPRTGLVDFFSIHDGRLVFLCWKLGEDKIRYWHTVEEGFRGRRPLTARQPREE
jgi:hypothetical protein